MTKSAVAPVVSEFASEVSQRLERLSALAADGGLDAAIGIMTRAIEAGAVIQAFGTGHSEAFAMEIAGRAGGLIPTNKITLRDLVLRGSLPVDALGERGELTMEKLSTVTGVASRSAARTSTPTRSSRPCSSSA